MSVEHNREVGSGKKVRKRVSPVEILEARRMFTAMPLPISEIDEVSTQLPSEVKPALDQPGTVRLNATAVNATTVSNVAQFTVTYLAPVGSQVDASTINDLDLVVTAPDGATLTPVVITTGLVDAASIQVTYQITSPSGDDWRLSDAGAYTVLPRANAVFDTQGRPFSAASPGQLQLGIQTPVGDLGVLLTTKLPGTAVTGEDFPANVRISLRNLAASHQAIDQSVTVALFASPEKDSLFGAFQLHYQAVSLKLGWRAAKSFHLGSFKVSSGTTGTFYLLAYAIVDGAVDSYLGSTPRPVSFVSPFVDIQLQSVVAISALKPDRAGVSVAVRNNGNFVAAGDAMLTISAFNALSSTVLASIPVVLNLKPAMVKRFRRSFVPEVLPGKGLYHLSASIVFPGDDEPGNDTAISLTSATVR